VIAKSSTSRPDGRGKIAVLALLAIGTLAFSLFLNQPGHISVDESVYHLMTRSFAESGSLALLNGYEEFPSQELVLLVARPHDGLLIPQYPYLYPVLAAPFYLALGYQGLFLLNAFAFLGVVWLCYGTCQLLFKDRDLSLNACLVLVLATYAWEYSQAAWPHAVSMLCIAGAFYLTVSALQAAAVTRALALAFAAGLVVGFGTGVRMEVIFTAPALVLPFLFASPTRLWPSIAAGLGTLPGLAVLGATNYVKFGTFSPFSYGSKPAGSASDAASYLPVIVLGGSVLLALWLLTRPRIRSLVNAHPWRFVAGLVAVAAAALLVPDVWAVLSRLAHGVYQLVVDLRIRDLAILEGALSRGPGGGMIYLGALKKSLLQSCPYLVVLLVVLLQLLRSGKDAAALSLLLLVPATFIALYGYFAWHGGLVLNLRYFLPMLPFTSILAGYVWREIAGQSGPSPWGIRAGMLVAGALFVAGVIVAPLNGLSIAVLEPVLLTLPLVLGGGLLLLLLAHAISPRHWRIALANASLAGLVVSFVWAGTVAFTYDYPRAWAIRAARHALTNEIAALVSPDSIAFVWSATPLSGLYELDRVRLAQTTRDNFKGFRPLLDFHLEAGRPIYGWFQPELWDEMAENGHLAGLRTIPLHEAGGMRFARIVEHASSVAEAGERAD
jgi:hypothetical protein